MGLLGVGGFELSCTHVRSAPSSRSRSSSITAGKVETRIRGHICGISKRSNGIENLKCTVW